MRTLIRAALVAVAVSFAVPALPALAQKPNAKEDKDTKAKWSVVAVKDLPAKVATAQKKAFPAAKITKVERSGTGADVVYRLSMTGKTKEAVFTPAGKLVK